MDPYGVASDPSAWWAVISMGQMQLPRQKEEVMGVDALPEKSLASVRNRNAMQTTDSHQQSYQMLLRSSQDHFSGKPYSSAGAIYRSYAMAWKRKVYWTRNVGRSVAGRTSCNERNPLKAIVILPTSQEFSVSHLLYRRSRMESPTQREVLSS